MNARRSTLKDVAKLAGVSFKTVSRVVNGESGVSSSVTSRVEAAIAELGYRPNQRARRLRQGNSQPSTIAVVHVDLSNPFFAAVHAGIDASLNEQGCMILSASSGDRTGRQAQLVAAFAQRSIDGMIVIAASQRDTPSGDDAPSVPAGIPVVYVDRDPGTDGDLVVSDHYAGAVAATVHLIEQGHRDIGFLGAALDLESAESRHRGFVDAMALAGLDPSMALRNVTTVLEAERAAEQLLAESRAPTAIFAAQNRLAMGTVRALRRQRLHHRVAVVGFDDFEMADLLEPGITVVPQDPFALGYAAGELLHRRMTNDVGPFEKIVLPVGVVERGSGELPGPGSQEL